MSTVSHIGGGVNGAGRDLDRELAHLDRERRRQRIEEGPVVGEVRLIAALFAVAANMADDFLAAHGGDCGCDFCTEHRHRYDLLEDVAAARYQGRVISGFVASQVLSPFDFDDGGEDATASHADDLRRIADLWDALEPDTEDEAESADADAVVVEGGAR